MDGYISYLMGAADISREELLDSGVEILGISESGSYKLEIPSSSLDQYKSLVKEKLAPGFWNEIVGSKVILFIFKHKDGKVEEISYSEVDKQRISELCSQFSGDPIEKTSRLLQYLASNDFYTKVINRYYL